MNKKLLYIGNKLAAKGNTLTVMETLTADLEREGYSVVTASSRKNKVLRLLDMIITFFKEYRKIDLVLIDTYSTSNFYYAYVIARLCSLTNTPYIPILHGGNLPARLDKNPTLSKHLFKNAKINVAPSPFLMDAFISRNFKNLIHIPNTIELEKYPYKHRKKANLKLLWVRSFSKIYNPMLALQIVEALQTDNHNVELCMIGPEKDGSLALCKSYAEEHNLTVTFPGLLSKEQWISTSASYDIFINTTNFDNTPVSIIEGMALGFPIVSTNVGGIPYLLENEKTALLVPPDNVDQFTSAIKKIAADDLLASRLSENARKASTHFDWATVKHHWKALLNN